MDKSSEEFEPTDATWGTTQVPTRKALRATDLTGRDVVVGTFCLRRASEIAAKGGQDSCDRAQVPSRQDRGRGWNTECELIGARCHIFCNYWEPEGSLVGFLGGVFEVWPTQGARESRLEMWGASPPAFLRAFPGPRGRPDLKNALTKSGQIASRYPASKPGHDATYFTIFEIVAEILEG
jgi:hypothetical protein